MKAIAYLRVSTENQLLGPEAQRAAIEAWAARGDVEVVSWHVDQGVSGAAHLADRPGLLDAVAALRATGAQVLVVAKRDRLARDVMIAAMVEREVEKSGATIVSADGAGAGVGPEAQLMRRIVDAFAEYERALIRARVRGALAVKKARGERVGTVPFGKRVEDDGRRSKNDKPVALVDDEAEMRVLRVARNALEQRKSLRQTVEHLRCAGYKSRSGKPFTLTQVVRMLKQSA